MNKGLGKFPSPFQIYEIAFLKHVQKVSPDVFLVQWFGAKLLFLAIILNIPLLTPRMHLRHLP